MTPACQTHKDTYYPPGGQCILCLRGSVTKKRNEEKAVSSIKNTYNKKIVQIEKQKDKKLKANNLIKEILKNNPDAKIIKPVTKSRAELKKELQNLWSKKMKAIYREKNQYICFITNKKDDKKGLFGLHVSHLHAKGNLWPMWLIPENSGLSLANYNVDKPETVAIMRVKLSEIWGKEAMENLDKLAIEIRDKINLGIIKKYPPTDWILASIQDLKQQLKKK